MSGDSVLIAALSGRALAQSARRAGLEPLVADCFADQDMREAACAFRHLPQAYDLGFKAGSLMAGLDSLIDESRTSPLGLVLGTGFEDAPELIARLSDRYKLLGCSAETIRRVKAPGQFFGALRDLGICHPETRVELPADPSGWLTKRVGGSGGRHVRPCKKTSQAGSQRYFQRFVPGTSISATVIAGGSDVAVAWSRQWTAPSSTSPFRYGGAVGSVELEADLETQLMDVILQLLPLLDLKGLVSFDFLADASGEPALIEVNPRPSATLDVFDDIRGTLFRTHLAACLGSPSLRAEIDAWSPLTARAAAYLYADTGAVTPGLIDWPFWTADRPSAGTRIGKGQPIATVIGEGASADEAERLCRERLGILNQMLYEDGSNKGKQ